jgi:hypothetical protein
LKEELDRLQKYFEFGETVDELTRGIYVVPSANEPKINIRKLIEYCKEKNIDSSDLSQEECEQFIIK